MVARHRRCRLIGRRLRSTCTLRSVRRQSNLRRAHCFCVILIARASSSYSRPSRATRRALAADGAPKLLRSARSAARESTSGLETVAHPIDAIARSSARLIACSHCTIATSRISAAKNSRAPPIAVDTFLAPFAFTIAIERLVDTLCSRLMIFDSPRRQRIDSNCRLWATTMLVNKRRSATIFFSARLPVVVISA